MHTGMASLFDNTTLSDEGIRSLTKSGLPSEYRLVAWKYILRLSGNAKEFGRFVALGPHSGESAQATPVGVLCTLHSADMVDGDEKPR